MERAWARPRSGGDLQQGPRLHDLAERLIVQPGIEVWWAPLDRQRQIWIQPSATTAFPSPERFPTPISPPGREEHYAQRHLDRFSTSTEIGRTTSQLAEIVSGETDWWIDQYVAARKRLTVNPAPRVLEIDSAEDWHAFVVAHGAQSDPAMMGGGVESVPTPPGGGEAGWAPYPGATILGVGEPWGPNDGLVPDWASAAGEWDGVHVTLWAFLTAMQVRIESAAGWTEPWTWGGEETTWLRWAFDSVVDLPPVTARPNRPCFELLGIPTPRAFHPRWRVDPLQ